MAFLETPRFPDDIAYGSKGGPMYNTSVIRLESGFEKRNKNWSFPLSQFDVAYGIRREASMYSLIEFFHAVSGRTHGYRFKDFSDYKSTTDMSTSVSDTDQLIGIGDNAEVDFQLIKTYTKGALSQTRNIKKPITGTVVMSLDDVPEAGFTVDTVTGIVTFSVAPAAAVEVKAGYQYDVPVRFESDSLDAKWEFFETLSTTVPITEIRQL